MEDFSEAAGTCQCIQCCPRLRDSHKMTAIVPSAFPEIAEQGIDLSRLPRFGRDDIKSFFGLECFISSKDLSWIGGIECGECKSPLYRRGEDKRKHFRCK